jgi:type II secretory pathway component PulJ
MRLRPNSAFLPVIIGRRSGYTLVEILVATTLTLMLMTAVVTVFGGVGDGISKSRRALEQFDRLRTAAQQLRLDLQGVTVTLDGRAARPEENRGYFEYIENGQAGLQAVNSDLSGSPPDVTVSPQGYINRDILMFTTRNAIRPFVGQYALSVDPNNPATIQSDVAEVAWFLRGNTLHRRVLLVAPGVAQNANFATLPAATFFQNNDISVRLVNGQLVPNSLGDLTKRENRFAHPASTFPFDARGWGLLGLPTLAECSSPTWMAKWVNGTTPPANAGPNITQIDLWNNANIASAFGISSGTLSPGQYLATDGTRLADDVVLTNVIGFDVKVWEPAMNAYVDLGYGASAFNPASVPPSGPTVPRFNHTGAPKSALVGPACVYDSYNFAYENEGIYNFNASGVAQVTTTGGKGTNGLDDDGDGIVDDASESLTQPPYPVPLRGIQVKIRCFEPASRQVREVTIEQDFLPK